MRGGETEEIRDGKKVIVVRDYKGREVEVRPAGGTAPAPVPSPPPAKPKRKKKQKRLEGADEGDGE